MTQITFDELVEIEDPRQLEERLIQAATEMRAEILGYVEEAQSVTHIPEALHRRFEEVGLYRMFIPRAHGGLEVPPSTFFKVIIEIARADMGIGWSFALSANHALMVANWFPAEIHEEVFDNGNFRAASMYAPTATAEPVEGGYTINGTVNYCSGIPHSTYFLGQVRLPGKTEAGGPRLGLYLAPANTYEIIDDWGNMLGLNSSGSNSIRFDNAFLPGHLLVEDADLLYYAFDGDSPGSKAYGNSMYSARHGSSFGLALGALCVGGAKGAYDEYLETMRTRKITIPPFVSRTEDPDFQRYLGGVAVKIATGEAAIIKSFEDWEEAARKNVSGEAPFSSEFDMMLGSIGREVMLHMWEVVEKDMYRTIGSTASKRGERFELIFRDMAQAAGHRNPQLRDATFRLIGQNILAQEA